MSTIWDEIFAELELSPTDTEAPPGDTGDWVQAAAEFRTRGFVRLLLSPVANRAVVHVASPDIASKLDALMERLQDVTKSSWTCTTEEGAFWISGESAEDTQRETLGILLRVVDTVRTETSWDWVSGRDEVDSTPDSDVAKVDAPAEPVPRGFEVIGETSEPDGFSFSTTTANGTVRVVLVFEHALDDPVRLRLFEVLRRNIRAKFDVDVEAFELEDLQDTNTPFARTAGLIVTPVNISGHAPTLAQTESDLAEYLGTIAELSERGVSALVFLGVEDARGLEVHPEPESDWIVDDTEDSDSDSDSDEMVFSLGSAESDALEPGRFDDERLNEEDSDAALVDVVLRHPGFSDRRVGQVLTILLSIEYHMALKLMNSAPCVLVRGVSQERASTMKSVVEGAGGKIRLTTPDRFGA